MDGSGVISTASSGSVNTLVAGTYSLMYSYTDKGGNTISVDRTVIVDPGNPASVEIHTG